MTTTQMSKQLEALKASVATLESALAAKTAPKVTKPSTKTEAIKAWKEARGITPEGQAAYKQLDEANFENDWAKWVAKRNFAGMNLAQRKEANRAEANRIRNTYRKLAGLPLVK